ncbi:hypothetical protein ABIB27_001463 [Arthrobacter sp. UYEF21]
MSVALVPLSMALAGPAAEGLPISAIFLFAGGVCPVLAVTAMIAARMPRDELPYPLDPSRPAEPATAAGD